MARLGDTVADLLARARSSAAASAPALTSIAQMVWRAVADLDLNPDQVFVTGLSAGGAMAAAMLATYPELFAAGAVIAGLPYGSACGVRQAMAAMRRIPELPARVWGDKVRCAAPASARWPRVSVWAGDADTTVTPAAAQALVLQWRDVHGCSSQASGPAATVSGHHTHQTWRGPDGGVAVELHRVSELGHGTPISTVGVDGCGAPGPWLLDVGVSSSLEIARSWGIAEARRSEAPHRSASNRDQAASPHTRRPASPPGAAADTISSALRRAGLLR